MGVGQLARGFGLFWSRALLIEGLESWLENSGGPGLKTADLCQFLYFTNDKTETTVVK